MKHIAAASLLALASALPLSAGELSDRYEAMGTMTAQIGGDTLDLVIPYDREKDRAYAEQKMIMGSFLTVNTLGRTVDDSGKPASPMLQVTLQKQMGRMALLSAELFDEQGYDAPMAMGADGGQGSLTAYELTDDNRLTATVEGDFLRLTGYTSEPRVADGAEPVPVTIRWTVQLQPLEQ